MVGRCRRPVEIQALGGWLVVLAGMGAVVVSCYAVVSEPLAEGSKDGAGTETETGTEGSPFAQVARVGLGSIVWSLSGSPDGRWLASATIGGEARLRDLVTGRAVVLEQGRMGSVRTVTVSPDGRVLAVTGGDRAVRLWDLAAGTGPSTLETRAGDTKCAAFSPDGGLLAVGGGNGCNISLWDLSRRRWVAALDGHRTGVVAVAFAPDGRRLVAGDAEGIWSVWDWDAAAGRCRERARTRGHTNGISGVVFSADGAWFATACYADPAVRLWDAATGAPRGELPGSPAGVGALGLSPDGAMLAVAGRNGTTRLWDTDRWQSLGSVRANTRALQSVAFSPSGDTLMTGGADGALRIWDVGRAVTGDGRPAAGVE
jgi:WD40 repeat protein